VIFDLSHSATTRSPLRPEISGRIVVAANHLESQYYLETALVSQGFQVALAECREEMVECLSQANAASLVIVDCDACPWAIAEVRRVRPKIPIVALSSESLSSADRLQTEAGGHSITLLKPVFHDALRQAILALYGSKGRGTSISVRPNFLVADAGAPRARSLSNFIEQASASDLPILVQGETGVGKEMLVREIHQRSSRSMRPLIAVNCAALPKELVESQLFGHERGAFTGADRARAGLFEVADGGTIFLDEIGDMDIRLQAKLLQVLQDQEFHPLGSSRPMRVDVRVMAATHRDLRLAVADGRMRADLFYRLNVMTVSLLPLRKRKSEILPLAEHFILKHSPSGEDQMILDGSIKSLLFAYDWPGNVRELENIVRRYLVLRDVRVFDELKSAAYASAEFGLHKKSAASPESQSAGSVFANLDRAKRQAQSEALLSALTASQWNRKRAAEILKMDYKRLLYQMKKFQIGERRNQPSESEPAAGVPLAGLDGLFPQGQLS
jgi:DNA-binding NtrC family response regulator